MMLDVFKGDAFSYTELVAGINLIPFTPTRLGKMGLFKEEGVSTLTVAIEMQNGVLTLVPTAPRGSRGVSKDQEKRTIRDFRTSHLPQTVTVLADEVQGLRAFGKTNEVETAKKFLMKKTAVARRDLDLTHEYQRLGALKGIVLDADGSTIYNYFTEFGVAQQVLDMNLDSTATIVRDKCHAIHRLVEDTLGGVAFEYIHALSSPTFFDALCSHVSVRDTFLGVDGKMLRRTARMQFEFGDIVFEEYRGTIGGTPMIAAGDAYAFPVGVPDLFKTLYAPANYEDTVNTEGLPFYMRGKDMDFNIGIEYQIQSNPLHMNTRPNSSIRLTLT